VEHARGAILHDAAQDLRGDGGLVALEDALARYPVVVDGVAFAELDALYALYRVRVRGGCRRRRR
jgi:hypothetical protein